jgi:hypothetical protein
VIIRFSSAFNISVSEGIESSTVTVGSDKVVTFTEGTGTFTLS